MPGFEEGRGPGFFGHEGIRSGLRPSAGGFSRLRAVGTPSPLRSLRARGFPPAGRGEWYGVGGKIVRCRPPHGVLGESRRRFLAGVTYYAGFSSRTNCKN